MNFIDQQISNHYDFFQKETSKVWTSFSKQMDAAAVFVIILFCL